jgi:peptidoglycan/xylan/chitin deacetylase (PgdA/CDA1 family)
MYHRVAALDSDPYLLCVSPTRFAEHVELLKTRWSPLPLGEAVARMKANRLPHRAVAVTFDDGYADNLLNAEPVLRRHGVPATVFVTSGYVGGAREFWWDELEAVLLTPGNLPERLEIRLGEELREWVLDGAAVYRDADHDRLRSWNVLDPDDPGPRQALCRSLQQLVRSLPPAARDDVLEQVRAWAGGPRPVRPSHRQLTPAETIRLDRSEAVEVGGHTVSHPLLSACPPAEQAIEIQEGKRQLEDIVGRRVEGFAYPFGAHGDYTGETIAAVREAGFGFACSNFVGRATAAEDIFQLPRMMVMDWPADELERRLHALEADR